MNAETETTATTNQCTEEEQAHEGRLLAAIANGDRKAFDEFGKIYRGLIFSVVNRLINNVEDSQDTTQEVMWQIWKKAATFDQAKGKPRTWIVTLSRNRAIDRVRANGRRSRLREAALNEATVAQDIGADHQIDPRLAAVASERRDLVRSAILELSDKQKEVLQLAYFADMTQAQIAEQLGEPLGTVKARLRRSVQRLQSTIGDLLEA